MVIGIPCCAWNVEKLKALTLLSQHERRVPLDKSEGSVKDKLSLAMREHRFVCHRTYSTKTL